MSMQKLKGIRDRGAYTAQRSMPEHLLLLEERVLREESDSINIPEERERIAQHLKEYKEQHRISNSFNIEDIQHYLLATTEREFWITSQIIGIYTSTLIQQVEGDTPITIDMQGKKIDCLLYAINTPRHITINNTKGNNTGAWAGSDHGIAHLTINNTKGDHTGAYAGSNQGTAHLTINNTKGKCTGLGAGCYQGKAYLIINNTKGHTTGAYAGNEHGKTIIVGCHTQGPNQFFNHRGIIVNYNPEETPRIENVTDKQRNDILHLIAQNTPSEKIMAYLVKNT